MAKNKTRVQSAQKKNSFSFGRANDKRTAVPTNGPNKTFARHGQRGR